MKFPSFRRQPQTPEKQEKIPTVGELFNDNKFLDYLDSCEIHGTWNRPQPLSLDAPADEDLRMQFGRYKVQEKVAKTMEAELMSQYAAVSGGQVDKNHQLQSRERFGLRLHNFETGIAPHLTNLPSSLRAPIEAITSSINTFPAPTEAEEDAYAAQINAKVEAGLNLVRGLNDQVDRLKTDSGFNNLDITNPANLTEVEAKMASVLAGIDSFVLPPEFASVPELTAAFATYRSELRARVQHFKDVPHIDYKATLLTDEARFEDVLTTSVSKPYEEALRGISSATTATLLAKETVGKRLDEMRQSIMEAAAANQGEFDRLREQSEKLLATKAHAEKLRQEAQRRKMDSPEDIARTQELYGNLSQLDRWGRRTWLGKSLSYAFSPSYRKTVKNVQSLNRGAVPTNIRETVKELRKNLDLPQARENAKQELISLNSDLRNGLPEVTDLSNIFIGLATRRLNESIAGATTQEQTDRIKGQLRAMEVNGLVGENIDVYHLWSDISARADEILGNQLMDTLDLASGNKNLDSIRKAIDRIADRKEGIGQAVAKVDVYNVVIQKLNDLMASGKLTAKRSQEFAELIRDNLSQRQLAFA
jgi:hypothetical protein